MEANLKNGRVWWIATVIVMMTIIGAFAWRTRLSADEQLEQEAINAAKKHAMLQTKRFWRSPGLVKDCIFGKADEGQYMAVYKFVEGVRRWAERVEDRWDVELLVSYCSISD